MHRLAAKYLNKPVKVLVVGAGGTGSRVLERLACMNRALIAKGHPYGFQVTVVDPDTVSDANIGRQAFYPCDVGQNKAMVLVNRINMTMQGVMWTAVEGKLTTSTNLQEFDLVIGCVDNRAARLAILRGLESKGWGDPTYWLDLGNRKSDGQAILGQVQPGNRKTDDVNRLPNVAELYPEMIDPKYEDPDEGPSCSLAEALDKQSLFINPTVADFGMNILWQLFTKGEIAHHAVFVNLESMSASALPVDQQAWTRFGIVRNGRKQKIERLSVTQRKKQKQHQAA